MFVVLFVFFRLKDVPSLFKRLFSSVYWHARHSVSLSRCIEIGIMLQPSSRPVTGKSKYRFYFGLSFLFNYDISFFFLINFLLFVPFYGIKTYCVERKDGFQNLAHFFRARVWRKHVMIDLQDIIMWLIVIFLGLCWWRLTGGESTIVTTFLMNAKWDDEQKLWKWQRIKWNESSHLRSRESCGSIQMSCSMIFYILHVVYYNSDTGLITWIVPILLFCRWAVVGNY